MTFCFTQKGKRGKGSTNERSASQFKIQKGFLPSINELKSYSPCLWVWKQKESLKQSEWSQQLFEIEEIWKAGVNPIKDI